MEEVPGAVDQVVAGRYRLREPIGRGGMGCVWRAEHVALHTAVAVKLLTPTAGDAGEAKARFLREAQAAASLKSVNVVQILDHGVDGEVPYIAMEYLEGESLKGCLAREKVLSPAKTAMILRGVMRGIARAHRAGIVHRDLKPDNIFLARDGDEPEPVVKILDFGIAKLVEKVGDDISTRTGAMMGTPYYMSPEQARGRKDLDARSDLWSLAVIVFECLTGERPFVAEALGNLLLMICADPVPVPSSVAPVPAGFDAWFARAMQRDPARRFATASEFASTLAEVLAPGTRWLDTKDDVGRLSLSDAVAAHDALSPTLQADVASGANVAALANEANQASGASHGSTASSVSRSVTPEPRRKLGPLLIAGAVGALGLGLVLVFTLNQKQPTASAPAPATQAQPTPTSDMRPPDQDLRVKSVSVAPPSATPTAQPSSSASVEAAAAQTAGLPRPSTSPSSKPTAVPIAPPSPSSNAKEQPSVRDPLRDL